MERTFDFEVIATLNGLNNICLVKACSRLAMWKFPVLNYGALNALKYLVRSYMSTLDWPRNIYKEFKALNIRQVSYVPDAGHSTLIRLCDEDPEIQSVSLTTEEEGVAMSGGAWLGGQRSALLLQSSGVGNCINMISLQQETRMPLFMIVTMRGEWGEFNPWQVAMGKSTQDVLEDSGVHTYRADTPEDVVPTVSAAAELAYQTGRCVAVLIGQRVIGTKKFNK